MGKWIEVADGEGVVSVWRPVTSGERPPDYDPDRQPCPICGRYIPVGRPHPEYQNPFSKHLKIDSARLYPDNGRTHNWRLHRYQVPVEGAPVQGVQPTATRAVEQESIF